MSEILVEYPKASIAVVTINRPARRNALDGSAWRDLGRAFVDLSKDNSIRAVILTGASGHFCAGDDIVAFAKVRDDKRARADYGAHITACYEALRTARMPVIAAISGACVGGGCTLALRADFRLADKTARFGVPPAKLGIVYPADSTQLLVALAGATLAKRLLYTGDMIGAEMASRTGLVSELVEGDVLSAALALAEQMVDNAPLSIAAAKMACDAAIVGRLDTVRDALAALSAQADASEDAREGSRAFAEKRKPRFTGR